ncbi:MAG TPA: hypothetical protein VEA80_01415 [Vitreimonas sp.]|uniref:hypothetical protein n=1 Tax=Vitreimonas sp. TaxID=3069702 RepID=UPI002D6FA1E6|nr:hypothetical protein [Vitreimonas sp.]HYD86110.1 hypothetical protein [Vitreimonas sp.]
MFRTLIIALALALAAAPAAFAQALLTPAQFRDAAIEMLRRIDPQAEIAVRDELSINVRRETEAELPEFYMNFDQAYAEYRANPASRDRILERWVRFAISPPGDARSADRVVALVRPRAMVEQLEAESRRERAANGHEPDGPIWRPFDGDLVEVLVFDSEEAVQYAMTSSLAEIGLTPDQAWALTDANTRARIGTLEGGAVGGSDRLIYITGGNGLAPSSLLNGGVCSNGAERFAFLVVERNGYVSGDRDDPVALRQFREMLSYLRANGGAMSVTPLGCLDGRVVEIDLTE